MSLYIYIPQYALECHPLIAVGGMKPAQLMTWVADWVADWVTDWVTDWPALLSDSRPCIGSVGSISKCKWLVCV
jgi:hypothetical protein